MFTYAAWMFIDIMIHNVTHDCSVLEYIDEGVFVEITARNVKYRIIQMKFERPVISYM